MVTKHHDSITVHFVFLCIATEVKQEQPVSAAHDTVPTVTSSLVTSSLVTSSVTSVTEGIKTEPGSLLQYDLKVSTLYIVYTGFVW